MGFLTFFAVYSTVKKTHTLSCILMHSPIFILPSSVNETTVCFVDRNNSQFQHCVSHSLSPPLSLLLSAAQDAGLDALAAVISRQKTMGQDIGNELDEQNGTVSFKNPYCWNTHMHTQQKSWSNFFCRVVLVIFLQSALLEDSDI